jgi:AraC-like DNA-binding protein
MKRFIKKSSIPDSKVFIIKKLIGPYFDPTFHFHPEYQLFLVLKGRGTRFIGDTMKPFKEGDLIFTGPNLPHVWRNDNSYFSKKDQYSTSGIVIYFQENLLGNMIELKDELESIRYLFEKTKRGLEITGKTRDSVSLMMQDLLVSKGFKSIIQLLEIFDVIATSSESNPITHNTYVPPTDKASTDRMNIVYEYVMQNFDKKVALDEIAELVNMTPTSFSRYFKTQVNKSFSDFLKEIRISHACKLLHEEKANINHIAYECGYHTLSNFNKQFKEITNQTPLNYKKKFHKVSIDAYGNF